MNEPMYDAVNLPVLDWISKKARRILDIGCGTGALGTRLKQRQECFVLGVTHAAEEAALARRSLDDALIQELDALDLSPFPPFDCIVASHVLEHVSDPVRLLQVLQTHLAPGGELVIALPNVLHWRQRSLFLRGSFQYTEGGIMDRTHLRFFDWNSAHALLSQAGLRVVEAEATGNFPLPGIRRLFPSWAQSIDTRAVSLWPGLFGFQFVFRCVVAQERA